MDPVRVIVVDEDWDHAMYYEEMPLAYIHDTRAATRFHIKPGGQPVAVAYLAGTFAAAPSPQM